MCLTIDELRGLCTPDNIYLTLHASKRLEQRGILIDGCNSMYHDR